MIKTFAANFIILGFFEINSSDWNKKDAIQKIRKIRCFSWLDIFVITESIAAVFVLF